MERFASEARKLVEAAALGLLATAPLYLAPASIAARLDAWLYDTWSRVAPPTASTAIAVAAAEPHAAAAELASAAAATGVELIVTTLPPPPSLRDPSRAEPSLLGRTPTGSASATLTPLWGDATFEPELDGVVRRDLAALPSLAYAAAVTLRPDDTAAPDTRPLLRFAAPESLRRWDPAGGADVRVIVAGPAGNAYVTPMGVVTTPELVALALDAHGARAYLRDGTAAAIAAWFLALGLSFAVAVGTRAKTRGAMLAWTGAAILALAAGSAAAFVGLSVWAPVTGPIAWLALSMALLAARRPQARARKLPSAAARGTGLGEARQAFARGQLREAWDLYRSVPASTELLPELYELGCALQQRGAQDEAGELFHRIAQTDSDFRDAARRLVRGNVRANTESTLETARQAIGRYELIEHIGRGAMGDVYLARDPLINRILALKAIDLSIGYDDEGMESTNESFMREATIAGSLSHPNIVTIYDVGEAEGLAYIAMEYVRGHHLSEFTDAGRLLPVATVLDLVARAADALDYAHRHNVVHRDIKPANIMYDWIADKLKITDFGIAKLIDANRTRTGIVLGTPAYMSPEQLEGRNVNGHTDLFALGVSLYQLLTGQLPFRGASMTNLMFVIANEPHESVTRLRADLPKSVDAIVDRALAKDASQRFQTGAEMAAAIRRAA